MLIYFKLRPARHSPQRKNKHCLTCASSEHRESRPWSFQELEQAISSKTIGQKMESQVRTPPSRVSSSPSCTIFSVNKRPLFNLTVICNNTYYGFYTFILDSCQWPPSYEYDESIVVESYVYEVSTLAQIRTRDGHRSSRIHSQQNPESRRISSKMPYVTTVPCPTGPIFGEPMELRLKGNQEL